MDSKYSSNKSEQNLRIIRFFCGELNHDDFAHEINAEKEQMSSTFSQKILDLEEDFQTRIRDIDETYASRAMSAKGFMILFGFILLACIVFLISSASKSDYASFATILLVISIVAESVLFIILKRKRLIAIKDINLAKEKMLNEIAELKKEKEKELQELSLIIDGLISAWKNAKASEEEVFKYINDLISSRLEHMIGELLDVQEAEIQDKQCAEVWTPTFMQCDQLPRPVELDFEQSKKNIYMLRYEIINPLKDVFPEKLSWDSFSYRILKKLNIADSNDLKLSTYNAVKYYDKEKVYLAGSYFYQRILCTEDFVSQFRCYINALCDRVVFTQAIQIHYADISAIGIEASRISEVFYGSTAIDKHVQTLSLELKSGSTYKMSGDAGSTIGQESNALTFYTDMKSKANETFETQIKNIRAFVLESKRRKEAEFN